MILCSMECCYDLVLHSMLLDLVVGYVVTRTYQFVDMGLFLPHNGWHCLLNAFSLEKSFFCLRVCQHTWKLSGLILPFAS
uniref:Uncharacterized protein n=1 Tax=Rhizophora mucronata TaxID=61149 RepID=A0A2P2PCG5_RHIMU